MRILHIIDTLGMGGAENVLIGLTEGQRKLGNEVAVMPLVCAEHTPIRDVIESNGISVIPLVSSGSVYRPSFIWKISKFLRHYDIVHVHLFPALYWAGIAKLLSFSKTSLVYTEHSTNNKRRKSRFLHIVDTIIYQYSYKMIIACADKVLQSYKESFPSVEHVCAINNGIDTQKFREAESYSKNELLGVSEDCFIVTMVARFMTMKRQDTIVEAMTKLPIDIHAVFVGGNETDEGLIQVKRMASDLGVKDRVHFLYIRKDVPRILKTSDVVIMASDYEGLSLSSIEGMAAGKPFVATNVDGLREVVGGAGFLFENKDVSALARIINKLYKDKKLYVETSKQCQQRSMEFDAKRMTEAYMRVYNNVLSL